MDLKSLTPDLRAKLKEVQTLASRATRRETQGDHEDAFQLYIESVQKYLYLIRNVQNGPLKDQLKEISSKLLKRAERIKSSKPHLRPAARNRLSLEEQDSVLKSSQKINQLTFRAWNASTAPSESHSMEVKLASIQPALSPVQEQLLVEWKPIQQLNPSIKIYNAYNLDPTDIIQDVVTDCSLIAAFAVLINHAKRFRSKLHIAALYPQNQAGYPVIPEDGIYRVKLFLNGIDREILVDDRVPISKTGSMMCAQSRSADHFWPALMEKAYMKVMGGYDFVGSNSSVDLHALTGWIPESIFTTSQDYRSERSWTRILHSYIKGDCLVSVGTNGNISHALEAVGLVPFHDYAIIDIQEDENSRRLITLYNAWNMVQPQSGSPSMWTTELRDSLPGIGPSRRPELVGTFTISWESLQIYFDTIYLNWNPNLFEFHRAVHFSHHPLPAFRVKFNPGSALKSRSEVWILLTRHLQNSTTDSQKYMSFRIFLDDDESTASGSHNLCSTNHGLPPVISTALSNATHLLAKFVPDQAQFGYLINFSFHGDPTLTTQIGDELSGSKPIGLTLQIYSGCPFDLQDVSLASLPFTKDIEGKWTAKTSGGNHALSTYMNNPMWRIALEDQNPSSSSAPLKRVNFKASLTTIDDHGGAEARKPLNLKLIRAGGDGRVYDVERRDLVADSGNYTLGRAELRASQLLLGKYTIVPSTFDVGVLGTFHLKLECDSPLTKVEAIAPEGAGMYKRVGILTWRQERESNACWRLSGGKGTVNAKFRLQATPNPGSYPIRMVLMKHPSVQDEGRIISPGVFTDTISGATMGPLQLPFTGDTTYTIVVEALGDTCIASGGSYTLTVYVDQPLTLTR